MKLFGLELFNVGQVSIINLISLTDTELFRILLSSYVMVFKAFIHIIFTFKLDDSRLVIIFVGVCSDAPFLGGVSLFKDSYAFPTKLAECPWLSFYFKFKQYCLGFSR